MKSGKSSSWSGRAAVLQDVRQCLVDGVHPRDVGHRELVPNDDRCGSDNFGSLGRSADRTLENVRVVVWVFHRNAEQRVGSRCAFVV